MIGKARAHLGREVLVCVPHLANGTGSNAYAGVHSPDIVGNIRVDQAWGLFQLSAAAHEDNGSYNTLGASAVPTNLSEVSGHPDTKWGGSVMAALQIKNLPTGAGDDIKIEASYAKGDTKNVIATSGNRPASRCSADPGKAERREVESTMLFRLTPLRAGNHVWGCRVSSNGSVPGLTDRSVYSSTWWQPIQSRFRGFARETCEARTGVLDAAAMFKIPQRSIRRNRH
jgi:Porin subfamily